MRASAVIAQQTLTAEAANVVRHAICDAQRRGHGQVTPVHVASSLLTISGSVLRQACLQSHHHLPHPLQCRALELCFNVALERLPTVQATSHAAAVAAAASAQPSFSNALVAALKRAQAHQRRGCPEQQQVPLLAVKVEMEQLIISILDDPSVSRVMREAGFSSTQVKNSLEEAMGSTSYMHPSANHVDLSHLKFSYADQPTGTLKLGAGFGSMQAAKQATSLSSTDIGGLPSTGGINPSFVLPLFQREHHRSSMAANFLGRTSVGEHAGSRPEQVVKEVMEILLRHHKRNPLIISEQGLATNAAVKELVEKLEKSDVDAKLKGAKILSPQLYCTGHQSKEELERELLHLRRLLDEHISSGVIVFLGDVQWLVDATTVLGVISNSSSNLTQQVAAELRRLVLLYGGSGRLWLIGTATNQTYWRSCQAARNSSLETEWGFQPVRIALGSNVRMLPRFEHPADRPEGFEGSLGCAALSQEKTPINLLRLFDDTTSAPDQELRCCPECTSNLENECNLLHEQELTSNQESVHSSSSPVDLFNRKENLSTWLQPKSGFDHDKDAMAKKLDEQSHSFAHKLRSLRQKWNHLCLTLHKEFHCTRPATPILIHEPASSSSQNPMTSFDEKMQSQSPTCASLDGLESRRGYRKLSISPETTWLSLQSQPTSKVLTGSTSELDVTEKGLAAGSFAASAISRLSHKEDLCNSLSDQRLDRQKSELTVQTDLALGRSVEQTKVSADCASAILFGGSNSSYKPLAARKYNIATRTAEIAMLSWQERFRHLSGSVSTDIYPSHTVVDRFKKNSFPFRVVKQVDPDRVKGLQANLEARVPWQQEASKAIATVVTECRSGMGKKRGMSVKSDTWLLFLGSDRVGKRNMAKALSESIFECKRKIVRISFRKEDGNFLFNGDYQQQNVDNVHEINFRSTESQLLSRVSHRGRNVLDRIAEAVRINPFSVVLLEDIDKADSMARDALNRAMEKGRLQESNGREVSFANVIVAMTSSVGVEKLPNQQSNQIIRFSEERLIAALGCGMRMTVEKEASPGTLITSSNHISVLKYESLEQKSMKGMGETVPLVAFPTLKATGVEATCNAGGKKRKRADHAGQLLEFDLNLPVTDDNEGLYRDEDLSAPSPSLAPIESFSDALLHNVEHCLTKGFCSLFDSIVTFETFNFDEIAKDVLDLLDRTASVVAASKASMEIEFSVIENLVAAVWEELCDKEGLAKWAKEVLEPSMSSLFENSKLLPGMVVKLVCQKDPILKECFTISGLPKSISTGPN